MSKQLDKLVEDIASVFCPNCIKYDMDGKICGLWREVLKCENATLPARYAIDRVLEAARDGMACSEKRDGGPNGTASTLT